MAKDPAFLFYSNDFFIGTAVMTFEEKGKYIHILCLMHQQGHLSEQSIKFMVGEISPMLKSKFCIDEDGLWYNKRLDEEIEKRRSFVDTRISNGKRGGRPKIESNHPEKDEKKPSGYPNGYPTGKPSAEPLAPPKENENEDVNEDIDLSVNEDEISKIEIKPRKLKDNTSDFVNIILQDFQEAFLEVFSTTFDIHQGNKGKERKAIGGLLQMYKSNNPNHSGEQTRNALKSVFKECCQVEDKWLSSHVSPSFILSQWNQYKMAIKKPQQQTDWSKYGL